jgi:GNAT superfamily N-acetyltransferase
MDNQATGELNVTRVPPDLAWHALDGNTVAGEVRVWRRPDGRHRLFFDAWRLDAYRPLADAVAREIGQDLYTTLADAEFDALEACAKAGFTVYRRESNYMLPTDPARTGLTESAAPLPPGIAVISAADADLERLRLLDDDLRQDVPGTDGWRWDPEGFRSETFGRGFDPETYLIAVDQSSGQYTGLVRVRNTRGGPRLSMMASRAPYRRRGITRALLRQAFQVVHERGQRHAIAEADDENEASVTLLRSLGAARTGGSVELIRGGQRRAAAPLIALPC